ncbi:pyrroline-5-carboxylate reductase [Xylanimonas protaetiae]|uniref:Pyrroline-5-carboxylate reductase n=2 Tax=Xylanimonas protaetiae TaxID=2509457 RepID=A0A4P6FA13_9MICO|nr:pyrroline-5-carboxylate reductase [Xylanimonas protaetiae]
MGEAVLAGSLRAGVVPAHVVATGRRAGRVAEVAERHGVRGILDNVEAVRDADVVVVAVKPKDVAGLLASVGDALAPHAVVVSVAAGLSAAFFEDRLPAGQPVVRVMPNTPAAIGAGMSAVSAGTHASAADVATVLAILSGTGDAVEVPEAYQAAAGALAGSGPAYMFYVLDALAEAGVAVGLSRELATRLAVQTMLGSARLVAETGEHPALARERVTSPGGTTVQGLRALDAAGVRAAFIAAVEAARDRTNEIAAELEA